MIKLNKNLRLERNISAENSLKKLSNTDDTHGGITTSVPCTVVISTSICPTLVCSNKCGSRG